MAVPARMGRGWLGSCCRPGITLLLNGSEDEDVDKAVVGRVALPPRASGSKPEPSFREEEANQYRGDFNKKTPTKMLFG